MTTKSITTALKNMITIVHKDNKKIKKPVGFIAALKHPTENKVYIGYSLCRRNDQFDTHLGKEIAINRAYTRALEQNHKEILTVPHTMLAAYSHFVKRCQNYFKNCEIK